jgi:pimeloyl-ACP methyl ester carboxylesterase
MDATQVVTSSGGQQAAVGAPSGLRRAFATVGAVSPSLAAWAAERMWFTPPRPKISKEVRGALARGTALPLRVDGRRVAAWSFGAGERVIALMHGWGGYAGQLVPFVEPLVSAGFRVVTFDALAHGASDASRSGLRLSTFFDFAGGLAAIQKQVGPLHAIVAHSGGAIATGIALRAQLEVDRLVMLAPMTRPQQYAAMFSEVLGLSPRVREGWQARALERIGLGWEELDVTREQTPRRPLLVIHDLEDKEVPFADGEALAKAWPEATLHAVSKLGHRRLLRDPAVISRTVEFLSRS